jgi:hypothetical protein
LDEFLLQNTDINGHATSPDWRLAEMATESFGIECGETTMWKHRCDLKIEAFCDWGGARGRLDLLRKDPGLSVGLDYRFQTQAELSNWLKQEGPRACAMKRKKQSVSDSEMVALAWDHYDHQGDRHKLKEEYSHLVLSGFPRSWNSCTFSS